MTDSVARPSFLDRIERLGNRLPDPVFIFVWLIGAMVLASVIAAWAGASAVNPVSGEVIRAESLLSGKNIRTLLTEMPRTLTGFAPLGVVLLIMLGAGLAERAGLLQAAIRGVVRATPSRLLTPAVILLGLSASHAADSGFVILVPLAGAAFAASGRHPIAGIAAAMAGCAGAFCGNPTPGQFDALILGITEPAARLIDPHWTANMVGNWWFTAATCAFFVPAGWWVTEKVVEPRLGPWAPPAGDGEPSGHQPLSPPERRGLVWAGLAAAGVIALWAALVLVPGAPLIDQAALGSARLNPFFRSLVSGMFLLFLAAGVAYGLSTGSIRSDRDAVAFSAQAMAAMAPYIVLAFVASHFIAMFGWSNLAAIIAIEGAEGLKASGLPAPLLLLGVMLIALVLDLFIGSASAKWAALAPVLVPMMMLLGVSPEMTTAAYRMGDACINMVSPLMVFFPLVLAFARQWRADFGVGHLLALLLPYGAAFTVAGLILVPAWVLLDLPVGPGASVAYTPPAAAAAPHAP